MRRSTLSRPLRLALQDAMITNATSVFDYGCGHGDDVRYLRQLGVEVSGHDPVFSPAEPYTPADVVNLGYVVNVIEDSRERAAVLQHAWALATKLLVVSARLSFENGPLQTRTDFADGLLTKRGTFQKFFEQAELREWLESTLDTQVVAAAPGVFYAFKDVASRESFSARRFTRSYVPSHSSRAELLYAEFQQEFDQVSEFMRTHGRPPAADECSALSIIADKAGGVKATFRILEKLQISGECNKARQARSEDLLVYLALSRFPKRCRFSELPTELARDVKAFFGSYTHACEQADSLLFSAGDESAINEACRSSTVGKLTPDALYIHSSALNALPALLRVYEGCARVLVGKVEAANVIKLSRLKPSVSYLAYPDFDRTAHPPLSGSLVVNLKGLRVKYHDYGAATNRPILHRKEEFVTADFPLRQKFERLTRQEERFKLFEFPQQIGFEQNWLELLEERGCRIIGHRLIRKPRPDA